MYLTLVLPPPPDPSQGGLHKQTHPELFPRRNVVHNIIPEQKYNLRKKNENGVFFKTQLV
jgi:hypothetical protein